MRSFLVFARRFEDFCQLRDTYQATAQDGPDPEKLAALTAAGKAVLDAALPYAQLAQVLRRVSEGDVDSLPPCACAICEEQRARGERP